MSQVKFQYRRPAELRDNPRNANTHPKRQLERLKRSIRQFGFITPIVIDEHDMLVCGHGRLEAARQLGLETVPTVEAAYLSEAQKRAFMLADNRIAEDSVWDEQKLAVEFEAILALDDDIEVIDTGFEIAEIDVIIEGQYKDEPDPGDAPVDPETVERVARRGDLWLLGKHRLFCGDALDRLSYQVLLGNQRAQMVFSDPPYNVPIKGHVSGRPNAREFVEASGEMSDAEFMAFLTTSCERMAAVMSDGALAFVCMDWRHIAALLQAGGAAFDELKALCVWDKGTGGMGSLYRSQHELVAVFKSGKAAHTNNIQLGRFGRTRTNIWRYPGIGAGKGRAERLDWHPTVKNLAMVADAILDCSNPGDLVLDTFAGSGTLAVACERTGRQAAMIELDPLYCDVILRRFCDVTGIEPVNAATGAVVKRRPPPNSSAQSAKPNRKVRS